MTTTGQAALIGGGVIGGGWAARFLLNGWDVNVFDPSSKAQRKTLETLTNARRSLPALYDTSLPSEGTLQFCETLKEAVTDADWVQESVTERLDLKQQVIADIQKHALEGAVIASSTSGFKPSELQATATRPAQVVVCHPFNPVYLLPLVEVVPSALTDSSIADTCHRVLTHLGMKPLLIRHEIDAHIADRLMEALWREALWLVNDDIASIEEIDDAIRFGCGLRWALMGHFQTMWLAGGEGGMRSMLAQFGPALKWPWSKLMDVPELTDELINTIANQCDAQANGLTPRDMERVRDDSLVAVLRALKQTDQGAGSVLKQHNQQLQKAVTVHEGLLQTVRRQVPPSWMDRNGHMHEPHYLELMAQASTRFLEEVGVDDAYRSAGFTYFSVESHLKYIREILAGENIRILTRILGTIEKKLHLLHQLQTEDGTIAATCEATLIHVDLNTRAPCLPSADVVTRLAAYTARHETLKQTLR